MIRSVTDGDFQKDVLDADIPVLVEYSAQWCSPCKVMAQVLVGIDKAYSGRVRIYTMDIDENEVMPKKYGVRGIPTLMLFGDGKLQAVKVGAITRSQVAAFLDTNI